MASPRGLWEAGSRVPPSVTVTPHPALRGVVQAIHVIETDAEAARVLPSTAAVLGFQYRGRIHAQDETLATAGITGIQSTAQRYFYEPATATVLVRFTAQGAFCLGVPGVELANSRRPLDTLLPAPRVREVMARLTEAPDLRARVAVVEALLRELPFSPDRAVERAQALLDSSAGSPSVAAVARELELSERQLERRFLARIGISPKRFARLRRFERAVALAGSARSLSELALDAGYFDQSHFIRDVRAFAGVTPSELFGPAR